MLLAALMSLTLCIAAGQQQPQPETTASVATAVDATSSSNPRTKETVAVNSRRADAYTDRDDEIAVQELTPVPAGPLHVARNRIMDSKDRPFLMRGTQLREFRLQTAARDARSGEEFGPYSATSLSAIRLRFNMNAVRLPLNVLDDPTPQYFFELGKLVRRANQVNLVVILAAREPGAVLPSPRAAEFWSRCAAVFKDYPNVIFDAFSDPSPSAVPQGAGDPHSTSGWNFWRHGGRAADGRDVIGMQDLVHAIRSVGAEQPIVVMSWKDDRLFEGTGPAPLIDDPNIIYEASPRYHSTRTDAEREAHFGFLKDRVPLLANWDLDLDDASECSIIPSDPTAASELVQESLDYFDAHQISWIVSVYEPGELINDFSLLGPTSLDNGWTCGQPGGAGLGLVVQAHMRATEEQGLFVVSASGGLNLPRGGYAIAYGPVMAERDSRSDGQSLPLSLGGISVQVTDALGVSRPAGIHWASAGWGNLNFVIPSESAPGPGRMTIERADGSSANAKITIADTAPGFWTGVSCRGPALGSATRVFADGRTSSSPISYCKADNCWTVPISLTSGATTRVRLQGNGFRHAGSAAKIEVTVGGARVPVVSFGPAGAPGVDQVTIEIPAAMRGVGETDLISHVNGRVSNAVRISIGGGKQVQ